jgi:hypothetical protein
MRCDVWSRFPGVNGGHGLIDRVGLECDRSGSGAIDAVRAIALMGALDFLAGLESV